MVIVATNVATFFVYLYQHYTTFMTNTKRTRGTVSFILRKSTKQEKPISLRFSYGRGKKFVYAIGHSVNPKYWDKVKFRVKNVVVVRNSNEINDLMRDLESELLDFVSELDSKQILITNELLKDHLNRFTHKGVFDEPEITSFVTYIEHHIKQKEKELGNSGGIIKYKQTLTQLKDFVADTGMKLNFEDIDNEFYAEFVEYLYNKKHSKGVGYAHNTIGKHIKSIRTFMNASAEEELHSNYKFKKFKIFTEETTAIYLTLEEQKSMFDLDLSDNPKYELARDIFLIGCEIGQRISDYHDLQKHTIVTYENEQYIEIRQQKTGKKVLCKITDAIEKIMIERYDGNLPPKIFPQKLNDDIKEIGKLAEIDELIKNERTQGGKKVITKVPKYKLIMGHTARRTFCTLKYKEGLSVHYIMQLSGHSSEREFMRYIRNPQEERVAQITNMKAFKNSSIAV